MKSDRRLKSPMWQFLLLSIGVLLMTETAMSRSEVSRREDSQATVELQDNYNARSEDYFSGRENIVGVVHKGTRAVVLESKIADNGLPAYRVRFQNGQLKGQTLWICGGKIKVDSMKSAHVAASSKSHPEQFADLSEQAIAKFGSSLMNTVPTDIANYCPAYSSLDDEQRRGFWTQLVSGLMKYESAYHPASHYTETTMGRDSVTGQQVVSAGLLQLSYQDERTYKRIVPASACPLSSQGGAAILDPQINLNCGVAILNYQVGKSKTISKLISGKGWIGAGKYWSTLRSPRTLPGIQNMTKNYCLQAAGDSRAHELSGTRRVVVR